MSSKPKIYSKNNKTEVRIQTSKGEQLSAREADALSQDLVPGLFPVIISTKGKKTHLTFDVTGYLPLSSFLKSELRKQHFAELLKDIIYTLKDVQDRFFNSTAILLNQNMVFVEPKTRKVRFIFVPIQLYASGTLMRDFYINIAKCAVFSDSENNDYIQEYMAILQRGINVSMFDMEEFVQKITETNKIRSPKVRCKKCNSVNGKDSQYCVICGAQLKSEAERIAAEYNPLQSAEAVTLKKPEVRPRPVQAPPAEQISTPPAPVSDVQIKASLVSKRLNKSYDISKSVFRIGKSEDSDCFIGDNPVISRNHAEIRCRGGHFFVADLFSTNKTFVNGQQLHAQKEMPIQSGDLVRFGNEEFEFRI